MRNHLVVAGGLLLAISTLAGAEAAGKAKSFACALSSACVNASNGLANGFAIEGTSAAANGVQGNTSGLASGVVGSTDGEYSAGVEALAPSGTSDQSVALLADGANNGIPLVLASEDSVPSNLLNVYSNGCGWCQEMVVTSAGNATITGDIGTAGNCNNGCARPNRRVLSYGSREVQATIEDVGEAHLRNGSASVMLDPTLAGAVGSTYSVFLTAEGDGNELYVSQRLRDSFIVRESGAGRSTMPFAYRIVARSNASPRQHL